MEGSLPLRVHWMSVVVRNSFHHWEAWRRGPQTWRHARVLGEGHQESRSSVLPFHRDCLGSQEWGTYGCAAVPNSVSNVVLGVEVSVFCSSRCRWYIVLWAVGDVLDMDIWAAALDGRSHGWLSGGNHGGGGGCLLGLVGVGRESNGGSGAS